MPKKKKMKPDLIDVVNDWLKINRPFLYVDDHGSIGLLAEEGMQSKAFGTLWFGSIGNSHAEFLNPDRFATGSDTMIEVQAADPDFFKKLAEHLPAKPDKDWLQ